MWSFRRFAAQTRAGLGETGRTVCYEPIADADIYLFYHDLWMTDKDRLNAAYYGIHSGGGGNTAKIRLGAGDAKLLLARFVRKHGHLSIIVVYAPTDPTEDHDKDNFYNQLSAATQSIPPHDILIVLGDFNASSGTYDNVGGVLGPFGSGSNLILQ